MRSEVCPQIASLPGLAYIAPKFMPRRPRRSPGIATGILNLEGRENCSL
tara:strand:- start:948 stop:1094 length:147 start_codon:yes stop_codon:yes gene_type:complete